MPALYFGFSLRAKELDWLFAIAWSSSITKLKSSSCATAHAKIVPMDLHLRISGSENHLQLLVQTCLIECDFLRTSAKPVYSAKLFD
jgi:hypothetical protein